MLPCFANFGGWAAPWKWAEVPTKWNLFGVKNFFLKISFYDFPQQRLNSAIIYDRDYEYQFFGFKVSVKENVLSLDLIIY